MKLKTDPRLIPRVYITTGGGEEIGMFEGNKKLFGGGNASTGNNPVQESPDSLTAPANLKPWEDRTLAPEDRLQAYKGFVLEELRKIETDVLRLEGDVDKQIEIKDSPNTKRWWDEGMWLKGVSAEDFCKRIDGVEVREALGKNFLGAEAWRSQGIDVGEVPRLPASITKELLESECPLHPGEKIKDTHLLVLVPKTVNGEPYSPLKLDELCSTRKGSGDKLIYDGADWATAWKGKDWASTPQAQSEWVLIPKSDPDPSKVSTDKHFRSKKISAQQKVHEDNYPEYREVKALEVMTMVLLYDLTNKERLLPDYLRCEEPNAFGGRVCVGSFDADGLGVGDDRDDNDDVYIGRALARKTI
jgi:hypothetical protein